MKISQDVQSVLNAAYLEAKDRHSEYLTPEHILYAALFFENVEKIVSYCGADPEQIRLDLEEYFAGKVPELDEGDPVQTIGVQEVIEQAIFHTESSAKESVDLADILVALFNQENSYGSYYLKKAGIDRYTLLRNVSHGMAERGGTEDDEFEDPEDSEWSGEEELAGEDAPQAGGKPARRSALQKFTRELTKAAM